MSEQPLFAPLQVNGWTLFAHDCFLDQLLTLTQAVEQLKIKSPGTYSKKNDAKRLAAIYKLAFEVIPQDPMREDYRQGKTLGSQHTHWFRAKFLQQYRLFFRFDQQSKIIIYAWVNSEDSLRAYGSRTDAYKVFTEMLTEGHPPNSWEDLLAQAKKNSGRLKDLAGNR